MSRGNSLRRVKNGTSKWRVKDIPIDGKPPTFGSSTAAAAATNKHPNELSPALLAQANWTFVEKLLKVRRFFLFSF